MINNQKKGIIVTYVLVFGAIFLLLLSGLLGFILLQLRQAVQKEAWNEALNIAEAGINYYRWCSNNEVEGSCQVEKEYRDPAGSPIGRFSLQITPTAYCGEVVERTISSTGWTYRFPNVKRTVSISLAKTSVAKYAYLINDNVWAGADREIRGLYHSNGGIRMDGENQSLVTSTKGDWICTSSFGCSSCPTSDGCWIEDSNCHCPGVFTTTGNADPDLFDFPVSPFDFSAITIDLAEMKNLAEPPPEGQGLGLYFPLSGQEGYHIVLKHNGSIASIDVWEVTEVEMLGNVCTTVGAKIICDNESCKPECPECQSGKCIVEDPVIKNENYIGNHEIPQDCGVVFFEDNLWVGGEFQESKVKGKITVVSADLEDPGKETDVWLQGNIEYTVKDGSDGLTIIAQHNNLIGLYSPDNMELEGIFIAQTGHFGRNYYPCGGSSSYQPHCLRDKLEITGSVVSNGRVGTKWTGGSTSGYLTRENYFDPDLIYSPPPFTPRITDDFQIVNWEEVE